MDDGLVYEPKCVALSVGRHQAFEFFKPVEDDVHLGKLRLLSRQHNKVPSIWSNVVVFIVLSFKEWSWRPRTEVWLEFDADRHHRRAAAVEELVALG